jgi:hypothetical protein
MNVIAYQAFLKKYLAQHKRSSVKTAIAAFWNNEKRTQERAENALCRAIVSAQKEKKAAYALRHRGRAAKGGCTKKQ